MFVFHLISDNGAQFDQKIRHVRRVSDVSDLLGHPILSGDVTGTNEGKPQPQTSEEHRILLDLDQ